MVTLTKLAKEANVSVSTVSKAFAMSNEINEETRNDIFAVAKKYGCFKKYYRAKYPQIMIAVICPEFNSNTYSYYLSSISERIKDYKCRICVAESNFSANEEKSLIEYYCNYAKVDGIILIDSQFYNISEIETPIVAIGSKNRSDNIPTVSVDTEKAINELLIHIKGKGIDNIGFVGERYTFSRYEIFKHAAEKHNVGITHFLTDKRFAEGGYDAFEKAYACKKIPKVIVCAYDEMAIGAISAITSHGLKVPDDISVIGINNIKYCDYICPPLSSVNTMDNQKLEIAIKMITDKIFKNKEAQNITVKAENIFRKSLV